MNPKAEKLRGELNKNRAKISVLQSRNRALEKQINELENGDILELVHSHDLNLTQLAALIEAMKTDPAPMLRGDRQEESEDETV